MSNGKSILDFFKGVLKFFETEAPVATAVMAAIPGLQLPAAAVGLISIIPQLCQTAEQVIGDAQGTGALKADTVKTAVNAFIMTLQKTNPNIDKSVWAQVAILIPTTIEQTIANVKIAQMAATGTTPAPAPAQ
jgi:hypothetical protein